MLLPDVKCVTWAVPVLFKAVVIFPVCSAGRLCRPAEVSDYVGQCGEGNECTGCEVPVVLRIVYWSQRIGEVYQSTAKLELLLKVCFQPIFFKTLLG